MPCLGGLIHVVSTRLRHIEIDILSEEYDFFFNCADIAFINM